MGRGHGLHAHGQAASTGLSRQGAVLALLGVTLGAMLVVRVQERHVFNGQAVRGSKQRERGSLLPASVNRHAAALTAAGAGASVAPVWRGAQAAGSHDYSGLDRGIQAAVATLPPPGTGGRVATLPWRSQGAPGWPQSSCGCLSFLMPGVREAGSNLLFDLVAQHPAIYAPATLGIGGSSPLMPNPLDGKPIVTRKIGGGSVRCPTSGSVAGDPTAFIEDDGAVAILQSVKEQCGSAVKLVGARARPGSPARALARAQLPTCGSRARDCVCASVDSLTAHRAMVLSMAMRHRCCAPLIARPCMCVEPRMVC